MTDTTRSRGPLGPGDERDACALIGWISRAGTSDRHGLVAVLDALGAVHHRAGFARGECDGAGVMVDLPRALWADLLVDAGQAASVAYDPAFTVVHLFAPRDTPRVDEAIRRLASELGYRALVVRRAPVRPSALGPQGRQEAPVLWQAALVAQTQGPTTSLPAATARVARAGFDVVSWSCHTVVYKVRGDAAALFGYFDDLSDERTTTAFAMGHLRFSTNTNSAFGRVQPFPLLGHNGEINTIARLRDEARHLGIDLPPGASDSQDLDRLLFGLVADGRMSLIEAMSLVFPPVPGVLTHYDGEEAAVLSAGRDALGPVAQGPAAIVARHEDEVVCSLDALGLRPLWLVQTADAFWVTSERGVVAFDTLVAEPRPLAPGEKLAFVLRPGRAPDLLVDDQVRAEAVRRLRAHGIGGAVPCGAAEPAPPVPLGWPVAAWPGARAALFGWDQEDLEIVRIMADEGRDPIGSLGYDGPLAALAEERRQASDFLHETVAVVTNPAIDREREAEHFSTQTWLGARPPLPGETRPPGPFVRLERPLLLEAIEGVEDEAVALAAATAAMARLDALRLTHRTLPMVQGRDLSLAATLVRLGREACAAVAGGAGLVVLDDGCAFAADLAPIDPLLAVGAVDRALGDAGLRRSAGVVVRSAGVRRLHDIVALLALGADAVAPYLLWWQAAQTADAGGALTRLAAVLGEGIEKVMSTMGIHELRGYCRTLSSLGLAPDVLDVLGVPGYLAGASAHTLARFEDDGRARLAQAASLGESGGDVAAARVYHIYPKLWKIAAETAAGTRPYATYEAAVHALEVRRPVALRHLLAVTGMAAAGDDPGGARAVAAVGEHRYPLVISSMSFGSQGEVAYRAYLEGARRAGILCMNGEGGEFADLVGRYGAHRGVQVASGRFGIAAPLLAATRYLEIKIGQGAKPGEGGHLPARKVSAKVALARNAQVGVDLISPSNNHDLYSIEDLRQLIDELREVSPMARVIVKVPVVPGIGTIAVGIAKAGADIITLSGFDGGTGACRRHSARHVGLPAEVGLYEAHAGLIDAGLRSQVELWCDGGMKTAEDVLKCMLLGANRVAFGTLAMVAVGCTICRACQTDTCHVGITTQVEDEAEAMAKGFRRFVPRQPEAAAEGLARLFAGIGDALATYTARLGYDRTQDLVGHGEHLVQARGQDRIDLTPWLRSLPVPPPADDEAWPLAWPGGTGRTGGPDDGPRHRRMVGTALAGEWVRRLGSEGDGAAVRHEVRMERQGVVGQGLGAFHTRALDTVILGGAQDGAAKGSLGGRIAILKARSADGAWRDGSVGKSFAYGAQGGTMLVQGDADSRAAVRFSGGSIVFGGRPHGPLDGTAARANLKGFAFEYMTGGQVVCLGDPGPWLAAGMTGGVVYVRLWPAYGLDVDAVRARLARGAACRVDSRLAPADALCIDGLLRPYATLLADVGQDEEAAWVGSLLADPGAEFVAIRPRGAQVPGDISTE